MMIYTWISTGLAYRLGWTLMYSLWEGAAIAAILAMILAGISRRNAQARYLAHIVAMVLILAAFAVTFAVGPESRTSQSIKSRESSSHDSSLALLSQPAPEMKSSPAPAPLSLPSRKSWMKLIAPPAAIAWLIGVLLLGAWRIAGWLGAQRLRVFKTEPVDSSVLQTARHLAQRLNLHKSFEILLSHFAQTPMVIGWLRPVILIPAAVMTGFTPKQMESILAHELAHIRRQDYLVNLLQILAETLLFYHPAVWWISRKIRLEREQACDDLAISLCGDRCEYAGSLAALEELRLTGLPAMAASGSGGGQMLARIRRILSAGEDAPRLGLRSVIAFLLVATAAAALYSQQTATPPRAQNASTAPSTQPFSLRNDAPRLSPFTAVRWRGDVPEVQYNRTWYELISIDDVSASTIMDYLTQSKDFAPQKHFAEDLVEVMKDMGHEPSDTVKLKLKTIDTQQAITITGVRMTEWNRRSVLMHDNLQRLQQNVQTTQPVASDEIFRFDVPFQQGATWFLDGDQIIVTSVRGTSANMESGICIISGKYTLASHDKATLAASVTANDSKDGVGPWNAAQTMTIQKGTGTFTLVLPISIKGWPHISFYGEKSDFGGSYIGTGDWVLRHWWGSK